MARLRGWYEARHATAAAAAEQRLADELAAKQAQLDDLAQQMRAERAQHRTAQASLDKCVPLPTTVPYRLAWLNLNKTPCQLGRRSLA